MQSTMRKIGVRMFTFSVRHDVAREALVVVVAARLAADWPEPVARAEVLGLVREALKEHGWMACSGSEGADDERKPFMPAAERCIDRLFPELKEGGR